MDRLEQLILKLLSEAVRLAETFLCGVFRAKRLEDGSEELLVAARACGLQAGDDLLSDDTLIVTLDQREPNETSP